jgi:hypothetical protein
MEWESQKEEDKEGTNDAENWGVSLYVCLPVCLSICVSVSLSLCLYVCLSVCLSMQKIRFVGWKFFVDHEMEEMIMLNQGDLWQNKKSEEKMMKKLT